MPYVEFPQALVRAAVATCDITPPVGIYHRMWGAATHDRSTGVHRPLEAACLALAPIEPATSDVATRAGAVPRSAPRGAQPESERASSVRPLVLVVLDHCLLWAAEMDELVTHVCTGAGLEASQLVVTFTHTHGAGLMGRERSPLPGGELVGPYLDELAVRVTHLVRGSLTRLAPATIAYGTGRCDLARHRDFWDAERGMYVCGYDPSGPADDTLLVARLADASGAALATVVNYACHPTTLAWENTRLSPDYIGALRETVVAATGAPCLLLQGASGDLGPREGFVGDASVADRHGRQLAHAVLSVLEGLPAAGRRYEYAGPVISGATIGTWRYAPLDAARCEQVARYRWRRWTLDLPYRTDLPDADTTRRALAECEAAEHAAREAGDASTARDHRAQAERLRRRLVRLATLPSGPAFPQPITLLECGDGFCVAVENEHYQQLQTALRARLPGVPILVVTLAGGSRATYLPPAEVYGQGRYQESVAVLAPGSLERLIAEVGDTLARWRSGS